MALPLASPREFKTSCQVLTVDQLNQNLYGVGSRHFLFKASQLTVTWSGLGLTVGTHVGDVELEDSETGDITVTCRSTDRSQELP